MRRSPVQGIKNYHNSNALTFPIKQRQAKTILDNALHRNKLFQYSKN